LDEQRKGHVVAHELEPGVPGEVLDVPFGPGEQVVDAEHLVSVGQQAVDQVRSEKARAAGDEDLLPAVVKSRHRQFAACQAAIAASCLRIRAPGSRTKCASGPGSASEPVPPVIGTVTSRSPTLTSTGMAKGSGEGVSHARRSMAPS